MDWLALCVQGVVFLVDADQRHLLEHSWSLCVPDGEKPWLRYLARYEAKRKLYLHREVMGVLDAGPGVEVDHVDNNTLNNRRSNLRIVSRQQNVYNARRRADNTSGVKGVGWSKSKGCWRARIRADGVEHHLGYFSNLDEAKTAREAAAVRLHGDFVRHG